MPIPKWIAKFNKHVTNRFFLVFAGRMPPFAIMNHTGRSSGQGYKTPVLAFPTETGFVFALTYGRGVDWVRNLVASGRGSLEYKGEEMPLCEVRLGKYADMKGMFPLWIRLSLWFISLEDCLLAETCIKTG
jgi:deazaflavin-dependent oxidoreductase (nitroreductase family)